MGGDFGARVGWRGGPVDDGLSCWEVIAILQRENGGCLTDVSRD